MMDEAILLAVGAADEAESLRLVEPLDGAGRSHVLNSCPVVMHLAGARVRTRCHANRRSACVTEALTQGSRQPAAPTRSKRGPLAFGRPLFVGTCPRHRARVSLGEV